MLAGRHNDIETSINRNVSRQVDRQQTDGGTHGRRDRLTDGLTERQSNTTKYTCILVINTQMRCTGTVQRHIWRARRLPQASDRHQHPSSFSRRGVCWVLLPVQPLCQLHHRLPKTGQLISRTGPSQHHRPAVKLPFMGLWQKRSPFVYSNRGRSCYCPCKLLEMIKYTCLQWLLLVFLALLPV